jgi:hypothetical protein
MPANAWHGGRGHGPLLRYTAYYDPAGRIQHIPNYPFCNAVWV